MNIRYFKKTEISGFFITLAFGLILRFSYQWSDGAIWSVIFASVNNSIWEQSKVYIIPYFVWSVITLAICKPSFKSFLPSKILGAIIILCGQLLVSGLFLGILGERIPAVELLASVVFVALGFVVSSKLSSIPETSLWFTTSLFALLLLVAAYICFTAAPPHIGLFFDSSTESYGIPINAYQADYILDNMYGINNS